ncbi:MAG: metallophosphoesterase [Spirochaetales bacterium]|nr:metallophosphoesterase [Spirochaetales bacterium]
MKIGVLSDSHDHVDNVRRAGELFAARRVEAVIHAGDICSQFTLRGLASLKDQGVQMYAVFGNNDGDRLLLERKAGDSWTFRDTVMALELGGRRIVVMHYPDVVRSLLRSGDFDLVIYGHNHHALVEKADGRLLLNPGSCAGYETDQPTVAIVDLERLEAEIVVL